MGTSLLIAKVLQTKLIEAKTLVAAYILYLSIVGSAAATGSQTTKKPPFRSQEDSYASKPPSDEVFTSEGATVSPGPISTTQSKETQNHIKTGSPTPISTTSSFPYLK